MLDGIDLSQGKEERPLRAAFRYQVLAEGEGFEPPVDLHPRLFSRQLH